MTRPDMTGVAESGTGRASRGGEAAAPRFPFVVARLPPADRIVAHLAASRRAGQFSNFGPANCALEAAVQRDHAPGRGVSACASCTSGLSAALLALGVTGPVLIPAFTFAATCAAVRGAGLAAVVADVEPGSWVLAPGAVAAAVRASMIGAVLAVRPYGVWSDLSALAGECRRHGVPLVIDNASGFGVAPGVMARFGLADAVEVFSLHATKPAGIGEGGLMVYPPGLHGAVRQALNFGLAPGGRGAAEAAGGVNGKMDELRAAAALAMLEELPGRVAQRQGMAAELGRRAQGARVETFVSPGEEWRAPWHCFPLLLGPGTDVDAVSGRCAGRGLQTRRYYHPSLAGADTPGAAALAARALCLPVYDGPEAARAGEVWDAFAGALEEAGADAGAHAV